MRTEIIQVRGVPADDVDVLRRRASQRGISLSRYLRELIHDETSRPSMTELVAQVAERDSVEASARDIRSAIESGRRQ